MKERLKLFLEWAAALFESGNQLFSTKEKIEERTVDSLESVNKEFSVVETSQKQINCQS